MFPLVIETIPENGSENVSLEQLIEIVFDGCIDSDSLNSADIRLINYNTNQEVEGLIISPSRPQDLDGSQVYSGILIEPPTLEPLTEYRLIVSNLTSAYGEVMEGSIELRFTTEQGSISEVLEPDQLVTFYVVRTYPEDKSITKPSSIRIKFNKDLNQINNFQSIMLLEGSSKEDALFMGKTNLIDETNIVISSSSNDIIEITPPELLSETIYTVYIEGVLDTENNTVEPYEFIFKTPSDTMFCDIDDILESVAIKTTVEALSISNDYINQIIVNNSELAKFIAEQAENTGVNWDLPDIYVKNYVKYKTQYDILLDKFMEISSQPTSKQLKDLSVEYGWRPNDLLTIIDNLKERYEFWEAFLKGKKTKFTKSAPFIRGENADENPDFMDRKFRGRDGVKRW